MTELRVLNVIVWGAMMIYMARGAWAAAMGRGVRRGDPMRLACFATGVVNVGFNARWLFAEDSVFIWKLLYVLSAAVGVYVLKLGIDYGRGSLIR